MNWLKLTSPRMRGPEVTRLQEILMALGYDLGPYGPDGIFGPDTQNAVKKFQRRYGLISDGTVGNLETWPLFLEVLEVEVNKNAITEPNIVIVDRRGQHEAPDHYRKDLSPRSWSGEGENVVRGVTLHQTGCVISSNPRTFDIGNFHIVVLRDGTIVLANHLDWYIQHAHDLSATTIGIEFEGNMTGIHGKPDTVWCAGALTNELTYAQVKAADFLFGWLTYQFNYHGGKWQYVYAHRQASQYRRADPGSEIWQKIGLKWIKWLNGSDGGPDFKIGDGAPIPKQWNPEYTAEY